MNQLIVNDRYALVDKLDQTVLPLVKDELLRMQAGLADGYATDYAPLFVPEDAEMCKKVEDVAEQIEAYDPALFFLIGIGGSHLGPAAIIQALLGTYYNELHPKKMQFYAVDTLDAYQMTHQIALLDQALRLGKKVILNIITKSGNTTETLVNAAIMVDIVKKYHPHDYGKYIVVTTDNNSSLYNLAVKDTYLVLEIPPKVGGRYSVFTPVGLLPLRMLGIDIKSLLAGAQEMRDHCVYNAQESLAAKSALAIYKHYIAGKNIHDTFLYSPSLSLLGAWYRQLVGESLGKKEDRNGKVVWAGITPTVSIGTNDLHSVAQLYLGGPYDKFTTFVYAKWDSNVLINSNDFLKPIGYVVGKTPSQVRDTIIQGVTIAYKDACRPFIEIVLPEVSPYFIGQFMMFKMIEVMLLGALMNVNPFDQPAVELYKSNTRRLLQ